MIKPDLSAYQIAKQQSVTPQYVRMLHQKYRDVPIYKLNSKICLRKPAGSDYLPQKKR